MWTPPQTLPLYETQYEKFVYQPFSCLPVTDPLQLDFTDLKVFESVQDQYQRWGIRFEGAIALRPSNPAFQIEPETIVLVPEVGCSNIAVQFEQLRKWVGAVVTATQRVKLTLLNRENEPIAEQWAGTVQYVQGRQTTHEFFPQHSMELIQDNIARVEFSSEAPFILHSFFCA
ncbi:hypothetical protein [Egbenema bharatensis]|uniref:hypothetical protein n=1 Tax=Egbenema bharatensis TaxID=3463334 RepID=UPI003A87A4F1